MVLMMWETRDEYTVLEGNLLENFMRPGKI
jgi:hypothetical protein